MCWDILANWRHMESEIVAIISSASSMFIAKTLPEQTMAYFKWTIRMNKNK